MNLEHTDDGLNLTAGPGFCIVGYRAKYAGVLAGVRAQALPVSTLSTPSVQLAYAKFADGPRVFILGGEMAFFRYAAKFEVSVVVGAKDLAKRAAILKAQREQLEGIFAAAGQPMPADVGIIQG